MADALLQWEEEALKHSEARAFVRGSTVLKPGHHGSQSSSESFLKVANPSLAIISTGEPEKGTTALYHFPEKDTLQRLQEHFSRIYRREEFSQAPLRACATLNGSCFWEELPLSPGIWSTAAAGTIDLYIDSGSEASPRAVSHRNETERGTASETSEVGARLCIEGELTARKFELTF